MSEGAIYKSFSNIRLTDTLPAQVESALSNISLNEKLRFLYNYKCENHLWPRLNSDSLKSSSEALNYKNLGNEAFLKGSNSQALRFYTRSVAVALPDSPELAIAYANRSAASFKLKRYEACLVDINRALGSNYPEHLRPKRIAKKEDCIAKLKVLKAYNLKYWTSFEQFNPKDDTLQKYLKYQINECKFDVHAMDLNYEEKFYLPSVNFKNKKIANASEKLKICFSPKMGRHVVAVEDIAPGEVLATEEPFVSILLFEHCYSFCSNCYVRCEALIPCNSCTKVMFCSQRCRDRAMNRFHRTECPILTNAINTPEIREKDWLAVRLLLIVTKQGEELEMLMQHPLYKNPLINVSGSNPETCDSKDFANMFNLVNHLDKRPPESWDDKLEMAARLLYILKSSSFFSAHTENSSSKLTDKEFYVGNLLLRFLLSLPFNHFVIDQTKGSHEKEHPFEPGTHAEKIGYGVYSFNSLFNHACENNVINHFHKDTNVAYAIKTIKAGEELCINYGKSYELNSRNERRTWLRAGYYFTCHCKACELNWPTLYNEALNIISPEMKQRHFELRALCQNLRIPLSAYPHSSIIFQFFCDVVAKMDKKNVQKPNREYMFWQRRIVLFVSARANYYENSRDFVLLSL